MAAYAHSIKETQKGVIFVGEKFVFALLGNSPTFIDLKEFEEVVKKDNTKV